MEYSEGKTYKLQADYYESIKLQCTYVEGAIVWLQNANSVNVFASTDYKLNQKTNKLYKWNDKFQTWDSIENTLSEHSDDDDVWTKRTGNQSYSYDGMNQGD